MREREETPNEKTWRLWMEGLTLDEIAAARNSSRHLIAAKIAHVIVTEFGDWNSVRAEKRLRQWGAQLAYLVRGRLAKGHDELLITRACNITIPVFRAVRGHIAGTWNRPRGPQIRGRRLAMLAACHRGKVRAANAARIANVSKSAAESVYRRIEAGKGLDLCGYCYIYHNDGTGLEEIKQCDE